MYYLPCMLCSDLQLTVLQYFNYSDTLAILNTIDRVQLYGKMDNTLRETYGPAFKHFCKTFVDYCKLYINMGEEENERVEPDNDSDSENDDDNEEEKDKNRHCYGLKLMDIDLDNFICRFGFDRVIKTYINEDEMGCKKSSRILNGERFSDAFLNFRTGDGTWCELEFSSKYDLGAIASTYIWATSDFSEGMQSMEADGDLSIHLEQTGIDKRRISPREFKVLCTPSLFMNQHIEHDKRNNKNPGIKADPIFVCSTAMRTMMAYSTSQHAMILGGAEKKQEKQEVQLTFSDVYRWAATNHSGRYLSFISKPVTTHNSLFPTSINENYMQVNCNEILSNKMRIYKMIREDPAIRQRYEGCFKGADPQIIKDGFVGLITDFCSLLLVHERNLKA